MNRGVVTSLFLAVALAAFISCRQERQSVYTGVERHKVFILTETQGYRHESIEAGIAMFANHATEWNIEPEYSTETAALTKQDMHIYSVIVLLNTTGNIFDEAEKGVLQDFVRKGGAVLAIHAAADAEYDWPWYAAMLGGQFDNHPEIQQANCIVANRNHPVAHGIPGVWTRTDEWYNFKNLSPENDVVITIDEATYSGGTNGAGHPISWCREYDGGKVFYTAMGHTNETYSEPLFQQHIKNALDWLTR